MTTIKITWKTFGNQPERSQYISSAEFKLEFADAYLDICNAIYKVTNLQDELSEFGARKFEIDLWETIKAILPANRTHTSLSVGDEIQIGVRVYEITNTGFEWLSTKTFASI